MLSLLSAAAKTSLNLADSCHGAISLPSAICHRDPSPPCITALPGHQSPLLTGTQSPGPNHSFTLRLSTGGPKLLPSSHSRCSRQRADLVGKFLGHRCATNHHFDFLCGCPLPSMPRSWSSWRASSPSAERRGPGCWRWVSFNAAMNFSGGTSATNRR